MPSIAGYQARISGAPSWGDVINQSVPANCERLLPRGGALSTWLSPAGLDAPAELGPARVKLPACPQTTVQSTGWPTKPWYSSSSSLETPPPLHWRLAWSSNRVCTWCSVLNRWASLCLAISSCLALLAEPLTPLSWGSPLSKVGLELFPLNKCPQKTLSFSLITSHLLQFW